MFANCRHVIWDWNGTLLDDLALCLDLMNGMLAARGLPRIDRDRYHAVFGFPVRNYYAALGLDTSDASFHALSVEFIAGYERRRLEAPLHPHARELLSALSARGITQSILSAYRHETLGEIVAHHGLTSHFVRLDGLDNIYAHSKAELGQRALQALNLDPAEVLLVGDTLHDAEVARELGVRCALIAHGHHPLARLVHGSPNVFPDLRAFGAACGVRI